MEDFCRSAMKKLGDGVVTDVQRIDTASRTYFSACSGIAAEFAVAIYITNASNISFQFLKQDSDQQRHIVTSACLPKREYVVIFDSDEFSSSNDEEVRRAMMSQVLDNLIMTPSLRRRIVDTALHTAHEVIVSRPPKHNRINISICVSASFRFDLDEMPVLDDEDKLRKEVEGCTVRAIDAETCAICLKDYFGDDGGSSKYVFTPCGHKFHVDCINGWLRVNCSGRGLPCPICRHNFDRFAVTTS